MDKPNRKTILIVDDSANDIELVKLMFKRSRIINPLQSLTSVQDAICYLKGEGEFEDRGKYPFPAMMLIDVHLSDGSGFDILQWVRRSTLEAPLALVVLSGSDVNAFRQAYELGAHSFLTKPLRFEDFHNMVTQVRGIRLRATEDGHLVEVV